MTNNLNNREIKRQKLCDVSKSQSTLPGTLPPTYVITNCKETLDCVIKKLFESNLHPHKAIDLTKQDKVRINNALEYIIPFCRNNPSFMSAINMEEPGINDNSRQDWLDKKKQACNEVEAAIRKDLKQFVKKNFTATINSISEKLKLKNKNDTNLHI